MAIGESEVFSGLVKGTLGIAKSAAGADLRTQLQFSNVDLDQCLGELFGIRRLEGKGNLTFAIESSGASVYELTKRLNGTAGLTGHKGAIAGFNVEQLLRRIERKPLSGGRDFRVGKTPYETLEVKLKIVDGVANVEDVRMASTVLGVGLTGSASIPHRELDLRGIASLLSAGAADAAPAFELPFMVQGPWDDPIMLPDPQIRIERSGAAAPLLDALKSRGASDAVRSVIDRMRGAPTPPPPPMQASPALAGAASPTEPPAERAPVQPAPPPNAH
jgi:AsmA protein